MPIVSTKLSPMICLFNAVVNAKVGKPTGKPTGELTGKVAAIRRAYKISMKFHYGNAVRFECPEMLGKRSGLPIERRNIFKHIYPRA